MDFLNANRSKLLLLAGFIAGIVVTLGALHFKFARNLFLSAGTTAESSPLPLATPTPPPAPAVIPSQPVTPPAPDPLAQAQSAVEAYIRKNAVPQCTFSFLAWSDFSVSGQASAITLRYRVEQPSRRDVEASVRFTMQDGSVVRTELVPGPQPARAPVARLAATPPPVVIDRFTDPINAAMNGLSMTLHLSDAYSLSQLDQAKQEAQAERKPLGFIMVWGQFFDHEADPRSKGSDSALVHFYEVFHQNLVLVFVRHETELGMVPAAVRRGFRGPDEGGFAPNMAVTDATAREFIVEIPYRGLDGSGRDELFAAGGRTIDQWLAIHPDALATSVEGNR